jgi:hypothetical protein
MNVRTITERLPVIAEVAVFRILQALKMSGHAQASRVELAIFERTGISTSPWPTTGSASPIWSAAEDGAWGWSACTAG